MSAAKTAVISPITAMRTGCPCCEMAC